MPRHTSQIKRIKHYFHTMLVLHVILAYVYNVYVCTTIKPVLKGSKLRTIPVKLIMWYGIIFIIHISIYCKRLRFRNVTALLVIFNPPPDPFLYFSEIIPCWSHSAWRGAGLKSQRDSSIRSMLTPFHELRVYLI